MRDRTWGRRPENRPRQAAYVTAAADADHGWITQVRLAGRDTLGRTLNATGTSRSRIVINRHTFIDINSLVRWEMDGATGWGEDQDMWPVRPLVAKCGAKRRGDEQRARRSNAWLQILRNEIAPAVEDQYARTQAHMAAVVLRKLSREFALRAEHEARRTVGPCRPGHRPERIPREPAPESAARQLTAFAAQTRRTHTSAR